MFQSIEDLMLFTFELSPLKITGNSKRFASDFFFWQKVTCKYAFELDGIPAESDYLEVRYAVSKYV